jgi:GNAT superfamily N-acetyltransferase
VRPYGADDLDPIVDLWYDTWHATFPDLRHHEPKDEWRRRFAEEIVPTERIFVAELEGQLAGFLAVKDDGEQRAYIHEIFVAPGFQRRGIGCTHCSATKRPSPSTSATASSSRPAASDASACRTCSSGGCPPTSRLLRRLKH